VVRRAFDHWKEVGIGLEFEEVTDLDETEIRIGFLLGGGSSSYVGRKVLDIPLTEHTMTFGWNLTRPDGLSTALHEIGHSLGLPHEHQNPQAGIVWDEEAVYRFLAGPPNKWSRSTTFHNVLRKLDPNEVRGSNWDPRSIMEYEFPGGLVRQPKEFRDGIFPPGTLSELDRQWALTWYPGDAPGPEELAPFVSAAVDLAAGEQVDFTLRPTSSRSYTIGTFGTSDTVLVLFEDVDGQPRFLAGDDDSGTDRNASITTRLRAGRTYTVRMRLYYPGQSGRSAVMWW
ncbi:MAG TPA: M12 family metallopeptidase, partial [Acidimicrobiales bacterium]